MPTPTRVKRMRRQVRENGGKATFQVVGDSTPTQAKILDVPFQNGSYTVVFQDFTNIAKQGAPVYEVDWQDIERPIRYNR